MTEVYIYDDHNPEDSAMLQALYSRSPDSVVNHIKKIQASGSGSFMSKFYVGYGHASIGDCGTTNIYIENVSMLVAKAFQDNPLYSGQEASTRYLDFSKQGMVDPFDTKDTTKIQNDWLELYTTYLPIITERVGISKPFIEGEYPSKRVWQNAVEARAFDSMRGFIPIGTKTYLSWTTNLRQAREKLMKLKYHPLQEVRTVALDVFGKLKDKYPSNWELSTSRSITVMQYMVNNFNFDQNLLAVKGYGPIKPVASNATSEGKSKNRRVVIVVGSKS